MKHEVLGKHVMRTIVKFRTYLNVVWASSINGKEAMAFVNGFPGTFFLTSRRAIVLGEFAEKKGWLRKKKFHRIVFEAGLHQLKDFNFQFVPKRKAYTGVLSFNGHNQLGDGASIQFLKIPNNIKNAIEEHIKDLKIKNPVSDTGIVLLDTQAPPLQRWLQERFEKPKF